MFEAILYFIVFIKILLLIFKDKFKKEHEVEVSRLIQVFNNNIWENKKSVK